MSIPAIIVLYDELAAEYERTRVPRVRPFVKRLLQMYDTRPGAHVLDAGCGTGLAATMVAPRVGRGGKVLGVDASARMLEIARQKARGFGFDQCEFALGDLTRLDVPDETFDLVICSFALWGEPRALFAEFRRVLKPQGALLLQNWELDHSGAARAFNETLDTFATTTPDARLTEVRALFARHRAAWADVNTPEQYARALTDAGWAQSSAQWFIARAHFADVPELIEFHSFGARARAELRAMSDQGHALFYAAVRDALQPLETPRGVDVAWRAIQVLARK